MALPLRSILLEFTRLSLGGFDLSFGFVGSVFSSVGCLTSSSESTSRSRLRSKLKLKKPVSTSSDDAGELMGDAGVSIWWGLGFNWKVEV